MNSLPLISVIIPCYNCEKYIGVAIGSTLKQTYSNIELIVINDGSTDASEDVIKSYSKVKLISQPNLGVSAARNTGLKHARGDYINFLDADDLFDEEKLERCMNHFNANTDIVFCEFRTFFENNLPSNIKNQKRPKKGKGSLQFWNVNNPVLSSLKTEVCSSAPIYRRQVFAKTGGFNEALKVQEDIDFFFRVGMSGAVIKKIDESLVFCRIHQNPYRISNQSEISLRGIESQDVLWSKAKEAGVLSDDVSQILADRYARYARKAYQAGFKGRAKKAFEKAYQLSAKPESTVHYQIYNFCANLVGLERMEESVSKFNKKSMYFYCRKTRDKLLLAGRNIYNKTYYGCSVSKNEEIIWIYPEECDCIVEDHSFKKPYNKMLGKVTSSKEIFNNHFYYKEYPIFHFCYNRWYFNLKWEDTGLVEYICKIIKKRGSFNEIYNKKDIIIRYNKLDQIFHNINEEQRIKPASELRDETSGKCKDLLFHFDPNGKIFFKGDGHHRFFIAHMLSIPIPGKIGVVHKSAFKTLQKIRSR